MEKRKIISTGFNDLDEALGGGFQQGLYVIGGSPSIGKTSLAVQLADTIKNQGKVLYFSLIEDMKELVSKTIVREIYKQNKDIKFSTLQVINGNVPEEEAEVISNFLNNNRELSYEDLQYICYQQENANITNITNRIREYIEVHGEAPTVIIDYLQAIALNFELTDKQNVDFNINELKLLSKEFNITIIVLSSINRLEYYNPLSLTSCKESGQIECIADVLIGMQLEAVNEIKNKKADEKVRLYHEAMAKEERLIELSILKNKYGTPNTKISYRYYPKFNFFKEITQEEIQKFFDEHGII